LSSRLEDKIPKNTRHVFETEMICRVRHHDADPGSK